MLFQFVGRDFRQGIVIVPLKTIISQKINVSKISKYHQRIEYALKRLCNKTQVFLLFIVFGFLCNLLSFFIIPSVLVWKEKVRSNKKRKRKMSFPC